MRQKARTLCPFFGLTPLGLMDTTAIDGCQPCCNVPRRYSHVKGRPPIGFAFLTAYSQCNGRSWALNFQQKCSHFKRQSHSPCMLGSLTAPGRPTARDSAAGRVAFQVGNPVGTRDKGLTRLNGQPARSPADASPCPLRNTTHGAGPA